MSAQIPFHPLAHIFPLLEGQEFADLVADIGEHGLREPIALFEGQILDGRNRYRACLESGATPMWQEFLGKDPAAYVVSLNLRRRHLSTRQRAMVADQLATLPKGANQHAQICAPSQERAAELLNVSRRSVQHAREIRESGVPELVQAVQAGALPVSVAAGVAALPEPAQRQILEPSDEEIRARYRRIRADEIRRRHEERIAKLAAISAGNSALPTERRYPVIYADPPWRYQQMGVTGRSVENHYPTLTLDQIGALPVSEIATDDAVLYLWTTAPHLEDSFRVITAWGFGYRTNFVWVKDKIGLGFHLRNQHELLLVATRGDIPTPQP
jgi:hypothetical protein